MPDTPRTIAAHELVYGSAAKLLEPGASDLGVIASTRKFPADIARKLLSHRGYTRHQGAGGAAKYIVGLIGGRLEFTRTEMGTDHTGRSIPFSRHVLLPYSDDACFGELVRGAAAHAKDPRQATAGWIEPEPCLSPIARRDAVPDKVARAIACAAETVIRYPDTKRPVVLIHPQPASSDPSMDPFLAFVAGIGDVLPRSKASSLVAVTHVIDVDDRLAEASVLATYPGTPFHREMTARAGSRRPLIVDLAAVTVDGSDEPVSAFVKATVADVAAGVPGRFADLCDALLAGPEQWPMVGEILKARVGVEEKPTLAGVESFVGVVKKIGLTPGAKIDRGRLQNCAVEVICRTLQAVAEDAVQQTNGSGRIGVLLKIDESLHGEATRVGVALHERQSSSAAKVLADAIAGGGEDAIAIARRVVRDTARGRGFLDLVEEHSAGVGDERSPPSDSPSLRKPPPVAAERKQIPQRVLGSRGQRRTQSEFRGRPRTGGTPEGSSFGAWLATLMLVPALFGACLPMWVEYQRLAANSSIGGKAAAPSGQTSDSVAGTGKKPAATGDTVSSSGPALQERVKAFKTAALLGFSNSWVSVVLLVLAIGLFMANGFLTQHSFTSLRAICGDLAATWLPTLVLLAVSGMGCVLGSQAVLKSVPLKLKSVPLKEGPDLQDKNKDGVLTTHKESAVPPGKELVPPRSDSSAGDGGATTSDF